MTETVDKNTGIVRHEFGTVSPDACRENIEKKLESVKRQSEENDVIRYNTECAGAPIEIRSTPTRTILFSTNRYALYFVENLLDAASWEYDNYTFMDYIEAR